MPFDPFADVEEPDEAQTSIEEFPDDPPFAEPTPTKEEKVVVAVPSEGKVVVTIKGASGHDAPWIVIHADDAEDALSQLDNPNMVELIKKTSVMANGFQKTYKPGSATSSGGSTAGSSDRKPPVATEAPGGAKKYCAHGEMEFKSGISQKTNKPYQFFVCTERDRNAQCKPQNL